MRYSGREFTVGEIAWLKQQIAGDGKLNRTKLSKLFCEQFNWRKANGTVKDVSCRVAFLRMERDGLLTLPLRQQRVRPTRFAIPRTLLGEMRPQWSFKAGQAHLTLERIDLHSRKLWNEYIDRYHYLGYKTLPGAQLRYFVLAEGEVVACLGFSASAWKVAARDQFIGWSNESREQNLHLIINHARFLILPWIVSPNLGSRILSLAQQQVTLDWDRVYNYRPVLIETFVDRSRFRGTVYKAANWQHVGETTGRGKKGPNKREVIPIKSVWLYPLIRSFRRVLCGGKLHEV